jgi:hypothetical protein
MQTVSNFCNRVYLKYRALISKIFPGVDGLHGIALSLVSVMLRVCSLAPFIRGSFYKLDSN